jgi:coenzyme PQQ biosynthesis protein PqqD
VSEASDRPRRDPSVAWRVIQGEAVMVLPATGKVHTLNAVGTRFWELIDGRRSLAEIAEQLEEEFDAPADAIAADCRRFAGELAERRLLSL